MDSLLNIHVCVYCRIHAVLLISVQRIVKFDDYVQLNIMNIINVLLF